MACTQGNWLPIIEASIPAIEVPWVSADALPSPWLFVSDCPESITSSASPLILNRAVLTMPDSGELSIRAFVWHVNSLRQSRNLYIGMRLTGTDDGDWSNHGIAAVNPLGVQPAGLCVAKAQLNHTLTAFDPPNGELNANTATGIHIASVPGGGFYGNLHELEIHGAAGQQLYFWTAATSGGNYGDTSNPVAAPDAHIRGCWPYSDVRVFSAPIFPPDETVAWYQLTICHFPLPQFGPPGPDAALFACGAGGNPDPHCHAPGNRGMFGVNGQYILDIQVTTPHFLSAWLRARNTGAGTFYQGAAGSLGVLPIVFAPTRQGVKILSDVSISAPTMIPILNATGGAANMPVELLVGISPTAPVPEPRINP